MTGPSTEDYLDLSEDAYALNGIYSTNGTYTPPEGYTVIAQSNTLGVNSAHYLTDGFVAVALQSASGNVIIVNEGTLISTTAYTKDSLKADQQISDGDQDTPALVDARIFAQDVETLETQQTGHSVSIYVTGHSLGGIEAQAEAKVLSTNFAGGATFGATGLPGQTAAGGPSPSTPLIDYVDYGDPVGNNAEDTDTENPLAPQPGIYHYGTVVMVGSPSNAAYIESAQTKLDNAMALDTFDVQTAYGGGLADVYANSALTDLAKALKYHFLDNYAADLGFPNPAPVPGGTPSMPLDWDVEEYTRIYGNVDVSKLQDEMVESNSAIVNPDFTASYNSITDQITIDQTGNVGTSQGVATEGGVTTLSLDPSTGLLENAVYASADGSTYNATFSEITGNLETLEVDENDDSSYQTNYNYNSDGSSGSITNGYSGSDLSGDLEFTETVNITSSGHVTVDISGNVDDITLNNAAITLEANSTAAISGAGNTILLNPGAAVSGTSADLATDNVTFKDADGDSLTFEAGAYPSTALFDNSEPQNVALTTSNGTALGTLAFDSSDNTDSFTLTDGLVVTLPGITDNLVTADTTTGATALQVLESYLTDLGYGGNLDAANGAYLDPAATSTYTVTGSSTISGGKTYTTYNLSDESTPGAVVDGTGNVNTLTASDTDLTHDSISNIGTLVASGTLSLTGAEFDSFAQVNGASTNLTTLSGTLTLTTSGIYSIAGSNVAGAFSLTAQAWGGTSLTGNGGDNETLTAVNDNKISGMLLRLAA